jgi:hypothetical protein
MTTPGRLDLRIPRGIDWSQRVLLFALTEDSSGVSLDSQDWSAATWSASYAQDRCDPNPVPIAVDATQANVGLIVLSLAAAQTALLSRDGIWNLIVTDAGQTIPKASGLVHVDFYALIGSS